ncbi:hypothetical protein P3342_011812 [Pyrenophora teres f. teres]|nr:hypothetical protein P3342_011812 [Pyrenophora teres f. teres]
MLAHFDSDLETWLETDASDFVTAAVLSQMHGNVLRPVAFVSHKMNPAECNYEIYDKELLAIVRAFEEWRFELAGTLDPVKVLSDHQALQTFMTNKRLNRRQARWAEYMSEFNFKITYRPGKQGAKPDALTRRPGDLPENTDDDRRQHQWQTVIKPHQVDPALRVATLTSHQGPDTKHAVFLACCHLQRARLTVLDVAQRMYSDSEMDSVLETCALDALHLAPVANEEPQGLGGENDVAPDDAGDLTDRISAAYPQDALLQAIIKAKKDGLRRLPANIVGSDRKLRLELGDCALYNDLLYVRGKLYVPDFSDVRTKVLNQVHRSLCGGGHGGKHETYAKLTRWYFWPRMTYDVAQYVRACLTCRRVKSHREGKHGLLHPLPIPDRYWTSISMDYITHLPACTDNGRTYENILVIVDRLSKKKKFIPVVDLRVDTLVRAFVEFVWREEGYPEHIVSDRGPQFTSHFWTRLCQRLGTKPKLSTAYHPETDGQTENANAFLKQYLRAYVNYEQDNWALLLPMAEFEANTAVNASTGVSAFVATKGYNPRSGIEPAKAMEAQLTVPARRDRVNADKFADRLNTLRAFLRQQLTWAQAKQAEYANEHRRPAPEFKVGDRVMVDFRNLRTTRPNQSLDFKNRGPFVITRVIDNMAYEVALTPGMRVHNVFHPWLLHAVSEDPLPGQPLDDEGHVELADPEVDDDTEYTVEAVLDSRINKQLRDPELNRKGLLQYKVRWADYPEGPDNQTCYQSGNSVRTD